MKIESEVSKFTKSYIERYADLDGVRTPVIWVQVPNCLQEKAMKVLHERLSNGEDLLDILKVHDTYFANKIKDGLIKCSDVLYYRITNQIPYDLTKFCERTRQSLLERLCE